jgi:hypothetical protein
MSFAASAQLILECSPSLDAHSTLQWCVPMIRGLTCTISPLNKCNSGAKPCYEHSQWL